MTRSRATTLALLVLLFAAPALAQTQTPTSGASVEMSIENAMVNGNLRCPKPKFNEVYDANKPKYPATFEVQETFELSTVNVTYTNLYGKSCSETDAESGIYVFAECRGPLKCHALKYEDQFGKTYELSAATKQLQEPAPNPCAGSLFGCAVGGELNLSGVSVPQGAQIPQSDAPAPAAPTDLSKAPDTASAQPLPQGAPAPPANAQISTLTQGGGISAGAPTQSQYVAPNGTVAAGNQYNLSGTQGSLALQQGSAPYSAGGQPATFSGGQISPENLAAQNQAFVDRIAAAPSSVNTNSPTPLPPTQQLFYGLLKDDTNQIKNAITALYTAVPVIPVQQADLPPIPGTERTVSLAEGAASIPTPEWMQSTMPTVDPQVQDIITRKLQDAQAGVAYAQDLLARSESPAAKAAAQLVLDDANARLNTIIGNAISYAAGNPSPQLEQAIARSDAGPGVISGALRTSASWGDSLASSVGYPSKDANVLVDAAGLAGKTWSGVISAVSGLGGVLGIPGFSSDRVTAIGNAIDPYGAEYRTASDVLTVAPFGIGPARTLVRSTADAALGGVEAAASTVPRSVTADMSVLVQDSAGFPAVVDMGSATARIEAVTNDIRGIMSAPSQSNPYAAFDTAVAQARAAASGESVVPAAAEAPATSIQSAGALPSGSFVDISAGAKLPFDASGEYTGVGTKGGVLITGSILGLAFWPNTPPPQTEQTIVVELSPEPAPQTIAEPAPAQPEPAPAAQPQIAEAPQSAAPEIPQPQLQPPAAVAPQAPAAEAPQSEVPPVLSTPSPSENTTEPPAQQDEQFRAFVEEQNKVALDQIQAAKEVASAELNAVDTQHAENTQRIQDALAKAQAELDALKSAQQTLTPQFSPQPEEAGQSAEDIAGKLSGSGGSGAGNSVDVKPAFGSGQWALSQAEIEKLAPLAQAMQSPELQRSTFDVVGHTDAQLPRPPMTNQELSVLRAQTVVSILNTVYGVPLSRMTASGMGDTQPLVPCIGDCAVNRRVEIAARPQ
jgi:flagellar motor protein MotB